MKKNTRKKLRKKRHTYKHKKTMRTSKYRIKTRKKRKVGGYIICDKMNKIKPLVKKSVNWFKNFDAHLRENVLCKIPSDKLKTHYLKPSEEYNKFYSNQDVYSGCSDKI